MPNLQVNGYVKPRHRCMGILLFCALLLDDNLKGEKQNETKQKVLFKKVVLQLF